MMRPCSKGLSFQKLLYKWKEFSKDTARVWRGRPPSTSVGSVSLFRVGGRANREGEEARIGSAGGIKEGCMEVQGDSGA